MYLLRWNECMYIKRLQLLFLFLFPLGKMAASHEREETRKKTWNENGKEREKYTYVLISNFTRIHNIYRRKNRATEGNWQGLGCHWESGNMWNLTFLLETHTKFSVQMNIRIWHLEANPQDFIQCNENEKSFIICLEKNVVKLSCWAKLEPISNKR